TIVLFLFVFTIAPIFAYFTTEDVGVRWVIYPLLIGAIVILTMIYPFQIFSWKRFVLKGTSISIGSRRFGVSEIREMHLLSDKKSTRLNSSHVSISYAVFCLKKKNIIMPRTKEKM